MAHEKVSQILKDRLPEFVKEDYQAFAGFVEAYYKFLEKEYEIKISIEDSVTVSDILYKVLANLNEFPAADDSISLLATMKGMTDSSIVIDSTISSFNKVLADSVTTSDLLSLTRILTKSDSVTAIEYLSSIFSDPSETTTTTDAATIGSSKSFSDASYTNDGQLVSTSKGFDDSQSSIDSISSVAILPLYVETVNPSDQFSSISSFVRTYTDTTSISDTSANSFSTGFSDSLSLVDSISISFFTTYSESGPYMASMDDYVDTDYYIAAGAPEPTDSMVIN